MNKSNTGHRVYAITGEGLVPVYVGATHKDLDYRLRQHINQMRAVKEVQERPFYVWLAQHVNEVNIFLLQDCVDDIELDLAERAWIEKIPNLLNLMTGGKRGGNHADSTRTLFKKAKVGYVMTEEHIAKVAAANKSRTGVKHTDEARAKIKEARARQVMPKRSEEHKKAISDAQKRRWDKWRAEHGNDD